MYAVVYTSPLSGWFAETWVFAIGCHVNGYFCKMCMVTLYSRALRVVYHYSALPLFSCLNIDNHSVRVACFLSKRLFIAWDLYLVASFHHNGFSRAKIYASWIALSFSLSLSLSLSLYPLPLGPVLNHPLRSRKIKREKKK